MGPYEVDYKTLFIGVLTDWRVIAIAVATLVVWALLRYVGVVFRTSSRISVRAPKAMGRGRASKGKAKAAEAIEIEE